MFVLSGAKADVFVQLKWLLHFSGLVFVRCDFTVTALVLRNSIAVRGRDRALEVF